MKKKQRSLVAKTDTPTVVDSVGLLSDLRRLIESARQRIATVARSTQTLLCWNGRPSQSAGGQTR